MKVIGLGCGPWRWYRGVGKIHMNRGRVGEGRAGKETDGCPLTTSQINICQSGVFPMMVAEDKNESPREDMDKTDEEAQDTCPAFHDDLDSEVDDFAIEEEDHVFITMVHLVNPDHFVHASSSVQISSRSIFQELKAKGFSGYCADIITHMPMSSAKQPLIHFQDTTNGTIPLSWSVSPHLDSASLSNDPDRADGDGHFLRATGRIRQSKSPLRALVFFIKKKDGKLCFIQDYQALNAITRKNWYLLPLINDLIDQLKDVHYFTKLDVHWGYNNVCICEGDEWKAVFRTNRG
jgi:hypothetical protein